MVLNLYINYFLVQTSALLMRRCVSVKRSVISAAAGAVCSLVILLPSLPFIIVMLEKAALCALITFISFGKQKLSDFTVSALFFLVVNFIFAGLMLALWNFICPNGMYCKNGVCTFNMPIGAVLAFTLMAYLTVRLVRKLSDKRQHIKRVYEVTIIRCGRTITIKGLCDTGCELHDILSGKPVMVCCENAVQEIVPEEIDAYLKGINPEHGKLRLIPCNTVTSNGLLPLFKAEAVLINNKSVDVFIGIVKSSLGNDIDCVFNPQILSF